MATGTCLWAHWTMITFINSLAPKRCGRNFKIIIFKLISWTDISCAACKIVVRWIPQHSIDDESTLVQVMAWCCQTTSHYLSQCWPRSMWSSGVTRPQWVNPVNADIFRWTSRTCHSLLIQEAVNNVLCDRNIISRRISDGRLYPFL